MPCVDFGRTCVPNKIARARACAACLGNMALLYLGWVVIRPRLQKSSMFTKPLVFYDQYDNEDAFISELCAQSWTCFLHEAGEEQVPKERLQWTLSLLVMIHGNLRVAPTMTEKPPTQSAEDPKRKSGTHLDQR